jgi:outer membrane receptor protein involved in Fe transport
LFGEIGNAALSLKCQHTLEHTRSYSFPDFPNSTLKNLYSILCQQTKGVLGHICRNYSRMNHINCLVALILLFSTTTLSAQDKQGTITGSVIDSLSKPLPYATVRLYKLNQTLQPLKSVFTNNKGVFKLTADTGKYVLSISHTGFGSLNTTVTINAGENVVAGLTLTKSVQTLSNITVVAHKPLIEQKEDRLIYNVEDDPAAKAEMATDILRKTPMITVDGDGNIQVNGQSNFKVLLNGRETSMFAMNVKDALKNFPGAVISKIEVITSPSAKYDAEGIGGVINIITKKKIVGYNAYIASYYSTLSNYNNNASVNMKSGKIGVSGYIGMNGNATPLESHQGSETTPLVPASYSKRILDGIRNSKTTGGYGSLEIVYDIDSFRVLALYGNTGTMRNRSNFAQSAEVQYPSQFPDKGLFLQNTTSKKPNSGFGADFIRRYRNAAEKELTFRFNGQFSKNTDFNNSLMDNENFQDRYVSNESVSKNRELTFQVDLVQPTKSKKHKFETGAKAILRNASTDFLSLVKYDPTTDYKPDPGNSDRFSYHQEVYSAYVSDFMSFKKFTLRTGIRMENTNVKGNFETSNTEVKQNYTNFIPNLLITRKFSNVYTLTASYNMRLQRPNITSLNPFINNNDSLNISFGNPDLGPQVLHNISIQNRFLKGKFFGAVSFNTSYTKNMIVAFASFDPATGVTSLTSANIGKEFQAGIGLNLNTPIGEKLTVGMGSQLRYNHIENKSNLLQKNEGISGSAFGNFNYKVVGKFTISGSGGVIRSPYTLVNSPSAQAFYQVNFGYKFLKEKLSITMNVNNFHEKYLNFRTTTDDPNFRIVSKSRNLYRVIYFGVWYNFGKLKEDVSRKKGVSNDDLIQ